MNCARKVTVVLGSRNRETNGKRRSPSWTAARHVDRAAVGADDLLNDRQAQTGSSTSPGARLIGSEESLKDVRQVFRGDPFAGVGYLDHRGVSLHAPPKA